jgi:hypothetical protein
VSRQYLCCQPLVLEQVLPLVLVRRHSHHLPQALMP